MYTAMEITTTRRFVADFEADTGIRVIQDTYDTAEEMYPIIKNGSANYDVVCTSDYMISKMKGENLLQKLDKRILETLKILMRTT